MRLGTYMCVVSLLLGLGWVSSVPADSVAGDEFAEDTAVEATSSRPPELARPPEVVVPPSVSVGYANAGRLEGGVHVPATDYLRFVTDYLERDYFYGAGPLVDLVSSAAESVAKAAEPRARLAVGELSAPEGGRISVHRSHQNGRDVDLGFYVVDEEGAPFESAELVRFRYGDEVEHAGRRLRFDAKRNWLLVEHLVSGRQVDVQYIFVSHYLRGRLLEEGARVGASPDVLERASRILMQPPRAAAHDDHFHVRVYCPRETETCRDRAPVWPWVN